MRAIDGRTVGGCDFSQEFGTCVLVVSGLNKMVKLTMIARVTDGLPLAEGLDDGRDQKDADFYKQQAKLLFKNLSKGQHEASRMSIETGPYFFQYPCAILFSFWGLGFWISCVFQLLHVCHDLYTAYLTFTSAFAIYSSGV
ncbi:hypothetical protein PR202_ga27248 [Eleusine coracana subsp. coracana]|uniref:Longin domain-containing protein n=1 Tax=Eleusine coracana subsp. coracana TaxID=191504 RepID=A0AAV5DG11_ELECO|nr:hypothetical protein PR202_ga27248 [Eleusine coracana subsp. coracana]